MSNHNGAPNLVRFHSPASALSCFFFGFHCSGRSDLPSFECAPSFFSLLHSRSLLAFLLDVPPTPRSSPAAHPLFSFSRN
ncbi:hypothetical protein HBH71_139820 [Parastagonospora nodorum]|nr:hypothetical protein HBH95_113850 [Parastagonospora nodorum]KAH5115134.1 hypothetical protein HBH71_139820 [Parastagonospora nodorum]